VERNPILQNDERHFGAGGGSGSAAHPSQRRVSALHHPSVESAELERDAPLRRNAELQAAAPYHSRLDSSSHLAGGARPDRGVRMVGSQSHRSADIFGAAALRHGAAQDVSAPSSPRAQGVRCSGQRNASNELLAGHNSLYDHKPDSSYFDREREVSRAVAAREQSHQSAYARRGDNAYAPADEYRSHHGSDSPRGAAHPPSSAPRSPERDVSASLRHLRLGDASSRVHRSPEQQSERDAYERALRQLHEERQDTERRSRDTAQRNSAYQPSRLW
jgi:hypothetical protein